MSLRMTRGGVVLRALPVLMLLGLGSMTQAQMCGSYGIRFTVTDKSGKAIKKARVSMTPEARIRGVTQEFKRDPKDASAFRLYIAEGDSIPGEYELLVGAHGYKTHIQKITFTYCQTQNLTVKLFKGKDAPPAKQSAAGRALSERPRPGIKPVLRHGLIRASIV